MASGKVTIWIGLATLVVWGLAGCSSDTAGPNRVPVARAGADRVIEEGQSVILDGSGSFDPDGDPLNYQWSLVSAPDGATATFDDPRRSSPSLTPDADGLWMISLVVSDTRLASDPDIMHLRVIPVGCTRDEDCDDGVDCTVDGCNLATQTCVFTPDDGACADDGEYCNGTEVCDSQTGCVGDGDPCAGSGKLCDEAGDRCVDCLEDGDCADAIACTADACDPGTNTCTHVPDDDLCPDDDLFCNGVEICDEQTGCISEGNPCTQSGLICNETDNECVNCQQDADCSDGIDCTVDTCDQVTGTCSRVPDHEACPDDGDFCNGSEICSETVGCTSSGNPCTTGGQVCDGVNNRCVDCLTAGDCDDLVGCTVDSCNPGTGTCVNTPDDGYCPDDGDYCNGTEYCHMLDDCLSTGDPCAPLGRPCDGVNQVCVTCGDGVASTTQGEDCDPAAPQGDHCCQQDSCTWTADGAIDPQNVCTGAPECQVDVCNGSGGCTTANEEDGILCTQDPDFCNGDEECRSGGCISPGNPCSNPADCDEGLDICTGCGDGVVSGSEDCDPADPQNDHCCNPSTCQWASLGDPDPQSTCSGAAECRVDVCDGAGNCTEVNAGDGTGCSADGVGCTDDTCLSGFCEHTANDVNCPADADFCNGNEYCDAVNDCSHTGDPCAAGGQLCDGALNRCVDCLGDGDCDDLVGCTDDTCNQAAGTCTSAPNDANCPDDGDFCTGSEFCDAVNDCDHTGDPCVGGGQLCDGANFRCVDCLVNGDCSDPLACTDDTCNQGAGTCVFTPNDANCPDDGDFCNGSEYCDAVNDCDHTGDPCTAGGQLCDGANFRCVDCLVDGDCSDPLACTDDTCNQGAGTCVFTPNDANCPDDGIFCNGTEYCDAVNDCDHTGDPCPGPDGDINCAESCNESGPDCTADDPDGEACDDGQYCTLTDDCQGGTCTGSGSPCSNPADCDEGNDSCGVCGDGQVNSGEDCDWADPQLDNCCDTVDCTWIADGDPDPQGSCSGAPVCQSDVCDGGGNCTTEPADEGNTCGDMGDTDCTDPDTCVSGVCDPNHEPEGTACGSATFCGGSGTCNASGTCDTVNMVGGFHCDGDDLVECDGAGGEDSRIACALGCDPTVPTAARCYEVDPSNIDPFYMCNNTYDLVIDAPAVIDTDAGTISVGPPGQVEFNVLTQDDPGLPIGVFSFNSITIEDDVTVVGSRPLALLACGDITINGVIDACADQQTGGPGGRNGGPAETAGTGYYAGAGGGGEGQFGDEWDQGGGGGGAFGGDGGDGGDPPGADPGAGGTHYGNEELVPLLGGSGGGGGGCWSNGEGGIGGGGGGAVQISAGGTLTISSGNGVNVCGAGGRNATEDNGAGGGGGAGGGILLEGVDVVVNGILAANGGGGGGGDEWTGGTPSGDPGDDGPFGVGRADGGAGEDGGGDGGQGGGNDTPDGSGGGAGADGAAGGGGGATGKIRINSNGGVQGTPTVSPIPATGLVTEGPISTW